MTIGHIDALYRAQYTTALIFYKSHEHSIGSEDTLRMLINNHTPQSDIHQVPDSQI